MDFIPHYRRACDLPDQAETEHTARDNPTRTSDERIDAASHAMALCPFPGKVAYPTRRAATAARTRVLARVLARRKRGRLEPYRCPSCGAWHLGHRPWRRPKATP